VIIPYSTIENESFKGFPKSKFFWVKASGWRAALGVKTFKCKRGVKLSTSVVWTCQLVQHEESFGAYIVLKGFKDLTMLHWLSFKGRKRMMIDPLALGWGPKRTGIETSTWVRTFTWYMIWPRVEIWDLKFLSPYCGYIYCITFSKFWRLEFRVIDILLSCLSCDRNTFIFAFHVTSTLFFGAFLLSSSKCVWWAMTTKRGVKKNL
jgi:hypothetical protein